MNQDVKFITEEVKYWIDLADEELHCFKDKTRVEQLIINLYSVGMLRWYFLEDKKGLMVYCITDDFKGDFTVSEIFMYIKPEYRGNLKLFKELVLHLEEVAKKENIKTVRIGSNIGYNDSLVLKVLERFGYTTDMVVKEIGK